MVVLGGPGPWTYELDPGTFGTKRWCVNIKIWEPQETEWQFLLKLLPAEQAADVEKFKFVDDQKRALVSRLMQRKCVTDVFDVPFEEVQIKRTKGKKPFVANKLDKSAAPNFNFNVSHEGHFVVLASEPLCICGIDVAAPEHVRTNRNISLQEAFKTFKPQLTEYEWRTVHSAGPQEDKLEEAFRRHWSLKEAFVKARGDGLGFELKRAEFHFDEDLEATTACVWVDGQPLPTWKFFLQKIGTSHWVSVARGPPDDIVDAHGEFTATFLKPDLDGDELQAALNAYNPMMSFLAVCDLLPSHLHAAFQDAGGELFYCS